MGHKLTENDGKFALRDHLIERARRARKKHGPIRNLIELEKLLEDKEVVRYPVRLEFNADLLQPGELAYPQALGEHPSDGFVLAIHPIFAGHEQCLPLIAVYQLVVVNYADMASSDDAEAFGAELLGLEIEDYYQQLCSLAEQVPNCNSDL